MHFHHGPSTYSTIPSSPPASAVASASNVNSSPAGPYLSPSRTRRGKERRNPSVTPRRFGRFFTPRSSLPGVPVLRLPLDTLGSSEINRQPLSPESLTSDALMSDPICSSPTERTVRGGASKRHCPEDSLRALKKRRGFAMHDLSLPELKMPEIASDDGAKENGMARSASENLGDMRKATLNLFFKASRGGLRNIEEKSLPSTPDIISSDVQGHTALEGYKPQPIRKFHNRGFESQLLNREHGFSSYASQRHLATPACDPRAETAAYYSRWNDVHQCTLYTGPGNTIPFSLASCHKAPVTAIGDEQGYVRLFKTTDSGNSLDSKVDIRIKAHDNAIMALDFSENDLRLATACGDRTGKIIDVPTQNTAAELNGGHFDSLRQIAFQQGQANGSTLATSDRAGRIQMWDLRCSPMPVNCFSTIDCDNKVIQRDIQVEPIPAKTVNTIENSHERKVHGSTNSASVTAIQWLPTGREHLLLSASEADATIKLWDTRYIKPRRQLGETALAMTQAPAGHAWRSYGTTSMALSSDAARLYAVCKDSTVYAYSTAHLILGHAPALEDNAAKRRPGGAQGIGPLYGFKHDKFLVRSFYVKCAIRPARTAGGPELLAVGSSESCAVLFPTDERYLRASWAANDHILPEVRSGSFSVSSSFGTSTPAVSTPQGGCSASSTLPMCRAGTPLIRGHSREVTTMSWSYDGKLVTASDDCVVRQWQPDATAARHLRTVGEYGGERHMAGWADVAADWDVDEEE
ncbi:Cell division cycle protein cdt2 [Beauveria bassiana D1-5]|uniref:Cell division cycle protein cdt2 n=1 Tax=Beauveria bassiana D1-5 TaxID=1245745 RepID=A0A0A2VRL7_BEABA|nr:Cell division cycle protein cdt2 [Beauveria bassiana D1-5]